MVRDVVDDDDDVIEVDEATFPSEPRGSSRHTPVSKIVAAASGEGDDDSRAAAVAFDTMAATSPRPLAPRKPTRATSSAVLCGSIAQTNADDKGRANLASPRANETSLARQVVGDDGGEGRATCLKAEQRSSRGTAFRFCNEKGLLACLLLVRRR